MIYELCDTSKAAALFEGWPETMVFSCLQKVMGKLLVTEPDAPKSALAFVGCFGFYAGESDRELVRNKPDGLTIMVPQNESWEKLIEDVFPSVRKVTRYAIKKDTKFDREALEKNISELPDGYELVKINAELYDKCLLHPATVDFVSTFDSKERFLKMGRGVVVLKNGEIVSGASSYSRYNEGIEIEVDTVQPERRKHLAIIACSALILNCLEEGLYPSWDAQNMASVRLAEKLGYAFDREYTAYENT